MAQGGRMIEGLRHWATEASAHAASVDLLALGFMALVALLSAPVFIVMTAFAIKYRRGKPADRAHRTDRNIWLETSWATIPFLLALVFYLQATRLFADLSHPPAGALEIQAVAKQWMWKFQHSGGQSEIDELHVPADRPVRLIMASQDVIHSLYIPALRIKQDVVPGRYTALWFNADRPGVYALACAEFCGADHSVMGGRFIVMSQSDYADWLAHADADQSLAAQGAAIFRSAGCGGCHDAGSTVRAPPLAGLYGRATPLADGRTIIADDSYIRDSILLPNRDVAAGYAPVMPTYQNLLGEGDVLKLVAYVKSLRPAAAERRQP